jgi:hypothetical protein
MAGYWLRIASCKLRTRDVSSKGHDIRGTHHPRDALSERDGTSETFRLGTLYHVTNVKICSRKFQKVFFCNVGGLF